MWKHGEKALSTIDDIKTLLGQSSETLDFITQRLHRSQSLTMIILEPNFIIKSHNAGLSHLLQSNKNFCGDTFQSILFPESHHLLNKSIIDQKMPIRFNFKTTGSSAVSLDCHLVGVDGRYIIIGDHPILSENEIMQKMTVLNNEMANLTREINRKNKALQKAQDEIKTLRGIVPICMYCKKIRDDKGYWNKLEKFIKEHSEAELSHCICPDCMEKQYPGYMEKIKPKG